MTFPSRDDHMILLHNPYFEISIVKVQDLKVYQYRYLIGIDSDKISTSKFTNIIIVFFN